MTEEHIQLDVEKINGYLCAIEMLNDDTWAGVEYTFIRLAGKDTLLNSVERNIAATYPDTILANWHISLEQASENELIETIKRWFFYFGKAETLSNELNALPTGFMELLQQLIYPPNIYRVTMIPPVWYAVNWETFAFDTKNGFFLLEFSFNC